MDLSVVIPVYNEEESIHELTGWIEKVCSEEKLSFEIIYIDDGSSDSSWAKYQSPLLKRKNLLKDSVSDGIMEKRQHFIQASAKQQVM